MDWPKTDAQRLDQILSRQNLPVAATHQGNVDKLSEAARNIRRAFRRYELDAHVQAKGASTRRDKWLTALQSKSRALADLLEHPNDMIAAHLEGCIDKALLNSHQLQFALDLAPLISELARAAMEIDDAIKRERHRSKLKLPLVITKSRSPMDDLIARIAVEYQLVTGKKASARMVVAGKGGPFVDFVHACGEDWDVKKIAHISGSTIAAVLTKDRKRPVKK
jgi:hypothetical protein